MRGIGRLRPKALSNLPQPAEQPILELKVRGPMGAGMPPDVIEGDFEGPFRQFGIAEHALESDLQSAAVPVAQLPDAVPIAGLAQLEC